MSSQTIVGDMDVKQNFDKMLERVDQGKEHVVVEKAGTQVAALIGIKEYEEFRGWLAMRLIRELGPKLSDKAAGVGLDEDELERRLDESRASVNRRNYGANQL